MALLSMRGFEDRSTATRVTPQGTWAAFSDTISVVGRFGGYCVNRTDSIAPSFSLATPASVLVMGIAVKDSAVISEADHNIGFHANGAALMVVLSGITLYLYRGPSWTGTIIGTYTGVDTAAWNYVELKATLADAGGTAIVRLNGVEVINFTGDTRSGGSDTAWTACTFDSGNNHVQHDDLYILDGTGPAPYNDFLGDVKVETVVPTGNGTTSQLTGSDGNSTDNYLLVDELPVSVTDYAGSSTVGDKDTYAMGNISTASGQVFAVQASALAFKSDAGVANMKVVERVSSGTERESTSTPLTASPGAWITTGPRTADPDSAAWTIASVNSAEFGTKVD